LRFRYLFVDLDRGSFACATCKHALRETCPCLCKPGFLSSWKSTLCVLHASKHAIHLVSRGQSLATCAHFYFKNASFSALSFLTRLAQIVPSDLVQSKHRLLQTEMPEGMCYGHLPGKYRCIKPRVFSDQGKNGQSFL